MTGVFKNGTYANPNSLLNSGYSVWYFAKYSSWTSQNEAPGKNFAYFMSGAGENAYFDPDRSIVSPQKGDLIFFAKTNGSPWAHVGIVQAYDSSTKIITYIDGNGTYESYGNYAATLVSGKGGNVAVSKWKLSLNNTLICAIARPNYTKDQ